MEPIDQLATALSAAQAEMHNAAFNRVNPHFKSKYADLASVRDAVLPVLAKHGLSVLHFTRVGAVDQGDGQLLTGVYLHTLLMHKSGQYVESIYPVTGQTEQQRGSSLSYGKRYALAGLACIAAEEDDDGNEAEKSHPLVAGKKKTAHAARKDGDWQALEKEMNTIENTWGLQEWGLNNSERIHALPDNWQVHFRELYERRMTTLREGVTEEGKDPVITGRPV